MKQGIILKQSFKSRSPRGSVMTEAAFVIVLLIGITFFMIEFGNVLHLTNTLSQISRSAVRYASVTPFYTQEDLVNASGANILLQDVSKLTLTINPNLGAEKEVGTQITVNVQYTYTPILNPFSFFNSNQSWAPLIMSASVARAEVAYVP